MTKIMLIVGDEDHDAMAFRKKFNNLEEVARNVEGRGGHVVYEDAGGEWIVDLSIHEFGYVDPDAIAFIADNFVDYDLTKSRDFYVLKEVD